MFFDRRGNNPYCHHRALEQAKRGLRERVYPKVQAPALVIRGGVDRLSPRRWCEEVAAALPDSRMAVVARRGHETLIADAADAAAAIRSFVAETAQT